LTVGGCIGKHDVTDHDWTQYLNFASRHWGKKPAHLLAEKRVTDHPG